MSMKTNPRIILTGGPCAGKSTLLHALKSKDFAVRKSPDAPSFKIKHALAVQVYPRYHHYYLPN